MAVSCFEKAVGSSRCPRSSWATKAGVGAAVRETNHREGAARRQNVVSKKMLGRLSHLRTI